MLEYLKKDFIKYGVTHSYKTIQALFRSFRIFVKSRNPNFNKGIHAHMLRHYFITNGFLNTGSAELMRMLTGHKSTKMLEETYIHDNESYQKIIWDQVNMPVLNSLEVQDLRKQLEIRNKMIIYFYVLKKLTITFGWVVSKLKRIIKINFISFKLI